MQKKDTLKKLESIDGVSSVLYENTDEYNKDKYTLFSDFVGMNIRITGMNI